MQQNTITPGRTGTLAAALLVATVVAACSPIDATTAPVLTAVSAKPAAQTAIAARFEFANSAGVGSAISSDGITGVYQDAVCGVAARVFFLSPNYLDGNLQLDNPRSMDRTCVSLGAAAYPRKLTIRYPDSGAIQVNTGGLNVNDMGTVVSGAPGLRSMNVRVAGTGARCTNLGFGNAAGGSRVLVTRMTSTSWTVSLTGGTAACVPAIGATTFIDGFTFAFSVTLN